MRTILISITLSAGTGNAEITFIDNSGSEKTTELTVMGKYYDRVNDALDILNQGVEAGHMSGNKINNTTACLRIKTMMFDAKSEMNSDYSGMQREIREKVLELKQHGIGDIVIDIRENGGIFIDSGVNRQSGNTLDVQVKLDEEAVKSLYDDGEDYLMKKAVKIFKSKS